MTPVSRLQTVSRRCYKNFNISSFLTEVYKSNINQGVRKSNDVDEAPEFFENSFRSILEEHAPKKTVKIRKNFYPFISDNTKEIILNRKALLEDTAKTDFKVLKKEVNILGKTIRKEIDNARKEYFENKFIHKKDSSNVWRTAKQKRKDCAYATYRYFLSSCLVVKRLTKCNHGPLPSLLPFRLTELPQNREGYKKVKLQFREDKKKSCHNIYPCSNTSYISN